MHPAELLTRYGHGEEKGLFCARTGLVALPMLVGAVAGPLLGGPITGRVRAELANTFRNGGQAAISASGAYQETSDDPGAGFFARKANRLNADVYGQIGRGAMIFSNLLNPQSKSTSQATA